MVQEQGGFRPVKWVKWLGFDWCWGNFPIGWFYVFQKGLGQVGSFHCGRAAFFARREILYLSVVCDFVI